MPDILIQTIGEHWSAETMLRAKGWFYLRDVFSLLDSGDVSRYKLVFKQVQRIKERGRDPFQVMGHRKVGGRVAVLMERFAPWYRHNPIFHTQRLDPEMGFQEFLQQKNGYFRLSEVCKCYKDFIPYSYLVLKRGADKRDDPLNEVGIVKSDTTYLVVLPRFEEWLRQEILG